jgi:glycerol-3-phosphate acyltransferase PlsX
VTLKIAVDAMGGDHAPQRVVEGALLAAKNFGFEIILVGDEAKVGEELKRHNSSGLGITIHPASEVVRMDESPVEALRKKKNSSIRLGVNLLKEGQADAFLSAGNTGAVMATAQFVLRTVPGVDRPAIATVLPNIRGTSLILDVGANVDSKPHNLIQFGIMGELYARHVMGREKPTMGLLSIGAEDVKGNELTKEVLKTLKSFPVNFIGNIEGRDVYNGTADVIVCDGFVGNIALKISEGVASMMGKVLRQEIESLGWRKIGYLILSPVFRRFKKRFDYSEYGGAPLLGVNGNVIISHGGSSVKALMNGIRIAGECVEHGIPEKISQGMQEYEGVIQEIRSSNSSVFQQVKEKQKNMLNTPSVKEEA